MAISTHPYLKNEDELCPGVREERALGTIAAMVPGCLQTSRTEGKASPGYGRSLMSSRSSMPSTFKVLVVATLSTLLRVGGAPFPAPDFNNCDNYENCCPPPYSGNITAFQFNLKLPMRTRQAAHLVNAAYIAKYQKAYALLKALPDTDGRSWMNQANLHCAYCDDAFFFPATNTTLEIHSSWLFLPWHRLYLYFHERILAKLIGDDTFTLPYWNWDNQTPTAPFANKMPQCFVNKLYKTNLSSLYDENRSKCALPPYIVDLNTDGTCSTANATTLQTQNNRIMYNQMVSAPVTPPLFYGQPYRYGDQWGPGGGCLENSPHGPVHIWTGNPYANISYDDMGNLAEAARDVLFYAHHVNVDRLWTIWKTLPGGNRTDITDQDWLDTAFTFYDENGRLVTANVSQSLDLNLLRYNYQNVSTPWQGSAQSVHAIGPDLATPPVAPVVSNIDFSIPACNPVSTADVLAMINNTQPLTAQSVLGSNSLTFKVRRRAASSVGVETLLIEGILLDWTQRAYFDAYLYFPTSSANTTILCPEFLGTFNNVPHARVGKYRPPRRWRAAIGDKLRHLGKDMFSHVVVTFVQSGLSPQTIKFSGATVAYEQ